MKASVRVKCDPRESRPTSQCWLTCRRLVTAYYTEVPDASVPAQRVPSAPQDIVGAPSKAFNEWHILAISQAICDYRKQQQIDGPLFLGMDTHALSVPALCQRARSAGGQRWKSCSRRTTNTRPPQ
jgi:phosphoglucomutase